MDLGVTGRRALICASSKGLGFACAQALAREGCDVILNGRDEARLSTAARQLRQETGRHISTVVANLNSPTDRDSLIDAAQGCDILVNNNAGPPPGKLSDWDHTAWLAALEGNMLAPVLLIRALIPGMRSRKFGRIVNITSAMVKSPHPSMGLSTAPRAALTAVSKAISRDSVVDNVTINNLLPERIETDRQVFMADRMMAEQGISREEARRQIVESVAAKRFGLPNEFGDACAFLCSAQAGFICGQNLQLDGGSYAGLI